VGVADEFGKQLFAELDYRQEARNAKRFKDLYGSIPGIYVSSSSSRRRRRTIALGLSLTV